MNKIKFKKIFLIATTACAMNAPLFAMGDEVLDESSKTLTLCSILEGDIGLVAGKFFSPRDIAFINIAVINKTNRGVRSPLAIQFSIEVCGQYILNDQPVPREIKAILGNVTNPTEIEDITKAIANRISHNSGGAFYRRNPLPPLLASFFRAISPDELDAALQPPVNQDVLPTAMLHMKTCGTFWVAEGKTADHVKNLVRDLINARAESYIPLKNAVALPKGTAVPKHIIATQQEINLNNYIRKINALFSDYPDHELVVDVGDADTLLNPLFSNSFPNSLRSISFAGENLTTIGNRFLFEYKNLTSITIPNSVTTIEAAFLYGCRNLTSLTIPNSVTTIGNCFLQDCTNLTSLTIPNSVTTIEATFLFRCTSLTSLTIPNSVTTIGEGFLWHCISLTSLTIPNSVTTIGDGFLFGCYSLTSITIPNSVTTIGDGFLQDCTNLTSLTIPERFRNSEFLRHLPDEVNVTFYENID